MWSLLITPPLLHLSPSNFLCLYFLITHPFLPASPSPRHFSDCPPLTPRFLSLYSQVTHRLSTPPIPHWALCWLTQRAPGLTQHYSHITQGLLRAPPLPAVPSLIVFRAASRPFPPYSEVTQALLRAFPQDRAHNDVTQPLLQLPYSNVTLRLLLAYSCFTLRLPTLPIALYSSITTRLL